ncbi:hypothetical protein [Undibacterium fentianense]|uniref:Uncharacterized protein n=1 Tax=Undibacterium fentianense TaxID=2828728 RepID=A0A941E5W2_9BURK|nr:hypothetical protein [Undibacterium fentianense]MBR7799328.1 hypothetical protein [Undibacterium fentianense]
MNTKLLVKGLVCLLGISTYLSAHALERTLVANHVMITVEKITMNGNVVYSPCRQSNECGWSWGRGEYSYQNYLDLGSKMIGFIDAQGGYRDRFTKNTFIVRTSETARATRGAISATEARKRAADSATLLMWEQKLSSEKKRFYACAAVNRGLINLAGPKTILLRSYGAIIWSGLEHDDGTGRAFFNGAGGESPLDKSFVCTGLEQALNE